MQVRPETAAMLSFRGSNAELARPEINIHYGVVYLAKAWRLAQGDLCRALMKYRAGHGEETMTLRSVIYCNRARNRLVAMNLPVAGHGTLPAVEPATVPVVRSPVMTAASTGIKQTKSPPALPARPTTVYATYRQSTEAASRAYWSAHEARVRAINARIEAKWCRVVSR